MNRTKSQLLTYATAYLASSLAAFPTPPPPSGIVANPGGSPGVAKRRIARKAQRKARKTNRRTS